MEHHTLKSQTTQPFTSKLRANSLQNRADEVLIAIAVLGLVATITDGEADSREIDTFTREFRRRFALSRSQSLKISELAVRRIRNANGRTPIDCACDTLNEHLDSSQKAGLFESLLDVLVADRRIHEGEEYFIDYVIRRLDLLQSLEKRYPGI